MKALLLSMLEDWSTGSSLRPFFTIFLIAFQALSKIALVFSNIVIRKLIILSM